MLALVAHLGATLALPALHQHRHRDDHRHVAGVTIWLHGDQHFEAAHAAFDADLAALDLSDAGHLGIASVDCELAAFTLADCLDATAPSHTFGDELLARSHQENAPAPAGPAHGAPASRSTCS